MLIDILIASTSVPFVPLPAFVTNENPKPEPLTGAGVSSEISNVQLLHQDNESGQGSPAAALYGPRTHSTTIYASKSPAQGSTSIALVSTKAIVNVSLLGLENPKLERYISFESEQGVDVARLPSSILA